MRRLPHGLVLLYEDKDILVVDKPAGLLTVATLHEKARTVHSILMDYIHIGTGRSRKRLFVVHRLDRETSGVLIFAKSEEAMNRLKDHWKENEKIYFAIVHGVLERKAGTITSYLAEDEYYRVFRTGSQKGKLAQTRYRVIREKPEFSLLEITLLTGKKNQIRVHMADIGHPILGDEKYGRGEGRMPRMALHARSISFKHPVNGKELRFDSAVPEMFTKLFGKIDVVEGRGSTDSPRTESSSSPLKGKGQG